MEEEREGKERERERRIKRGEKDILLRQTWPTRHETQGRDRQVQGPPLSLAQAGRESKS